MLYKILNLFNNKSDQLKLLKGKKFTIVDVRTKSEFLAGHVKGSVNIPLHELDKVAPTVLVNKNETIVTCCASGIRSESAKTILKKLGYSNVINGGGWTDVVRIMEK